MRKTKIIAKVFAYCGFLSYRISVCTMQTRTLHGANNGFEPFKRRGLRIQETLDASLGSLLKFLLADLYFCNLLVGR